MNLKSLIVTVLALSVLLIGAGIRQNHQDPVMDEAHHSGSEKVTSVVKNDPSETPNPFGSQGKEPSQPDSEKIPNSDEGSPKNQNPVPGSQNPASGLETISQPTQNDELWVDVDQSTQTARILKGNTVIKTMVISSGKDDTPTPNGTFYIQNRGEWFYSEKYKQGGKYWVSFKGWGKYLFHSVPFNRDKQLIEEEASLLGQKASHGCIRLSVEDARWFYENIPQKTKVEIHD